MTSDDHMRFAKCIHVSFDIFPKMMQEILSQSSISPQSLLSLVIQNTHFRNTLNTSEMNAIQTMASDGFTKLNVSLIYKFIRYFRIVPSPTSHWGAIPLPNETTLGDDIERIRIAGNQFMHKCDASISEQSYREFFDDIMLISRRLDYYLNKPREKGYENMIQEYKSSSVYNIEKDKLLEDTEKDACLKRKKIPEQITKMDEESINIYLKALETGSEQRRDINLVIVGKKGVGKTSLVRRLFMENITDVKSTNGIEVHRRRCRISLNNWEWSKISDTTAMKESSINNRLLQAMVKRLNQDMENKTKHTFETSSLDVLESDENEENTSVTATGQVTKQHHDRLFSKDEQLTIPESITASHSSELALQMLSSIIRPNLDLVDEDSHATLTVWDFAGDKEFYNTHQTFINPEAIYLVVANLADINDTESQGTFNFWMDTIHCYGSISELPSEGNGLLDPAVIAVGTHKDKFEDEEKCKELLASYTNEIFTDSKLHLRSTHLISNTDDQDDVFRELRNEIFAIANKSSNWNREYPVKFIQIEKALNWELMNGKRIIPFERVQELGSNTSIPITDDKELRVFLRYQHAVGNIFFLRTFRYISSLTHNG